MKKYLLRLGYILFLAYIPGVLLVVSSKTTDHLPPWLNLWDWLYFWGKVIWAGTYNITFLPVSLGLIWLIYSWIKHPTIFKAVILLAASIFLNPLHSPDTRLIMWLEFDEPFF